MSLLAQWQEWSEWWLAWAKIGLLDGVLACGIIAVVWQIFGRRLPPRLGACLFSLAMLKCALPMPISVPLFRAETQLLAVFTSDAVVEASSMSVSTGSSNDGRSGPPNSQPFTWTSVLFALWIACVLAGGIRMILLWRRARRLVRVSKASDIGARSGLQALLARGDRGPIPPIRTVSGLHSPAVTGIWRPVILLPEGLVEKLSEEQMRWVLAHELAHVRAGDLVWQWLELLTRTVLFFNPVVWLASAQAARLRERACDEAALNLAGVSRQVSAQGFVSLIEWSRLNQRVAIAGVGMSSAGRQAGLRVRALASAPMPGLGKRLQAVILLCSLAGMLPSYRLVQAQSATAPTRLAELEKRVAELEEKLKAKSRLESLRERAIQRAHARVQEDNRKFPAEQLREIEQIYQDAKKHATTVDLDRGFKPLLERYPTANRTGCAVLLLARVKQGAEREQLLLKAIKEHGDAYFLDGTSVGGVARLMLAQDADAAGQPGAAQAWKDEIVRNFASELDFGAVPLVDVLNAPATKTQ